MLQQTQVVTVVPFFEKFIQKFPNVKVLADSDLQEVLKYWAGLGYYSRARNLHQGAKQIVQLGRFPETRAEWLEIPGVGNYTAGAILSIALNQPEAILDGNVERVLSRVRRVGRTQGDAHFKSRLWRLSRLWVERAYQDGIAPSQLNQALMELGATLCTPRSPECPSCPLRQICRAEQKGDPLSFPPKKKPKTKVHLEETLYAWVNSQGEVLLALNSQGEWRAGLWDLTHLHPRTAFSRVEKWEEFSLQYIVTRHQVKRRVEVWKVSDPITASTSVSEVGSFGSWRVAESSHGSITQWVPLRQVDLPLGAPAKKSIKKISGLFN